MKYIKNQYLLAVVIGALGLLSGCAADRQRMAGPADLSSRTIAPLPLSPLVIERDLARAEQPLPSIGIYPIDLEAGEETPTIWGRFNGMSFLRPDPEHNILDSEDEQGLSAVEATDRGMIDNALAKNGSHLMVQPEFWRQLASGFSLPVIEHQRIDSETQWYASHPEYLDRTVERAQPYLHYIYESLRAQGLPMEIALLPIVESAYQPFAYSHGRAAGLWQFIPSTGRIYGLKQNWWYDGRRDVVASTQAAIKYLNNLKNNFGGDWLLALAAYNSGTGTVQNAIRKNARVGKPVDFWSLELPRETRAYVPKLLALKRIFARPENYGIELQPVDTASYFSIVDTGGQIDLALAADLAGISLEQLYLLNPGFNRWATDPDGPHHILLPIAKADEFRENLSQLDPDQRISWARHRIREGETLGHIAQTYHTTVSVLRRVNNIKGNLIRQGQSLIIPVARRDLSSYALSQEQRRKKIQNSARGSFKTVHTVQNGDTLWDLSRLYKVGVRELAQWNGMAPRDMLRPGQRLVIWQNSSDVISPNLAENLNIGHPLNNVTRRINYVVRKGDSLARISQRFNVKISQLRHWNDLTEGEYLQPGQKLTLFVDVTRQSENI